MAKWRKCAWNEVTCLKGCKTFPRVVFDLLVNWTCHDADVVSDKDLDLARESERLRRENRIPKGGEGDYRVEPSSDRSSRSTARDYATQFFAGQKP